MTYDEWCNLHGLNHENDDNYELYAKWLEMEQGR